MQTPQQDPQGKLAENILYFARALRAAGIPVGPGSVLDALAAVRAAGVGTKEDFYWTLHAVFVKRHEHSVLFDQAFHIFFRKRGYLERMMALMAPTMRMAMSDACALLTPIDSSTVSRHGWNSRHPNRKWTTRS